METLNSLLPSFTLHRNVFPDNLYLSLLCLFSSFSLYLIERTYHWRRHSLFLQSNAGFNIDVTMWSQQLSFIVVGIIVFTSTRGYTNSLDWKFFKFPFFRSSTDHVEIFHLDFLQQEFQCAGFVFLTNYG